MAPQKMRSFEARANEGGRAPISRFTAGPLGGAILSLAVLSHAAAADMTILNASGDRTGEFYTAFDKAFARHWDAETGEQITIEQSYGGSNAQARAVMNGMDADVVTLGVASDVDALAKAGLVARDWQTRLPDDSCPYTSTIVFLVRKGNPKGIKDWSDLERGLDRGRVAVLAENPKVSSEGRWSFLAAWGWALDHWNGDQDKAREFVARIYKSGSPRIGGLETGAQAAMTDFIQRGIGDVLLVWENEAMPASRSGQFEMIRPSESILVEPPVALVDRTVDARGTRGAAEAYLNYLYSDVGQELAAANFYRPRTEAVLSRHAAEFPHLQLFTVAEKFGGWSAAQAKYFGDGGEFDRIYAPARGFSASRSGPPPGIAAPSDTGKKSG